MRTVKIYFASWKKLSFARASKASAHFFRLRIKNKDFKLDSWWVLEHYDNKNTLSILAHGWTSSDITNDEHQELWAKAYRKWLSFKKSWDLKFKLAFQRGISSKLRFFIEKWFLMAQMKDDFFKSKEVWDKKDKKDKKTKEWKVSFDWVINKKLISIVEAIDIARELISKPSNIIDPDYMEKYVKDNLTKWTGLKISYFWQKEIEKEKMWLLLAVNFWSKFRAKMITMEYSPPWATWDPILIVWKWITYDSWWYYFKSNPHMNDMHADMAWAWNVIWIMSKLKVLGVKRKVVWIIWITENMIDANSYKNWDIYTARNWKTVEIGHTDAEWRLILADLLSYWCEKFKPALTIDIATLTWVCIYALWEMYTGIFSGNKNLLNKFQSLWDNVNDLAWPLPLDKDCKEAVKWKMADISNTSKFSWMLWASTAAAFISNFVPDTNKWIHFDIAWTWMRTKMRKSYDIPTWVWTWSWIHLIIEYLMKP